MLYTQLIEGAYFKDSYSEKGDKLPKWQQKGTAMGNAMKMEGEKRKKQRSRASNKHPHFKAIVPKHPIKFSRRFSSGHTRKLSSRSAYGSQKPRYSTTVSGDQYTLLYND